MKKRFSEEQIVGILREAEAGVAIKELCRKHGFSEASYYAWRKQARRHGSVGCKAPEELGSGERTA